jgi:hypothetical protein
LWIKKIEKGRLDHCKIADLMSCKKSKQHVGSVDSNANFNVSNDDSEQSCTMIEPQNDPACCSDSGPTNWSSQHAKLRSRAAGRKRAISSRDSAMLVDKIETARRSKKNAREVPQKVTHRSICNIENDDTFHREGDGNCDVLEEKQQWPQDIHRQFVEAIFEVGVTHASPSLIMEQMTMAFQDVSTGDEARDCHLTSEHLKSHLQKYRKNKQKSKEDFMRDYDQWLLQARCIEAVAKTNVSPANVAKMMGNKPTLGGDAAAYLTYSLMMEGNNSNVDDKRSGTLDAARTVVHSALPSAMEYAEHLSGAVIACPIMTEEERHSSVGISLSSVIGMFYSLTQSLMAERNQIATTPALTSDSSDAMESPP